MARARLSTRDRVRIFDAAGGVCHLCGRRIEAGQGWDVSHPIPLALGGADDDTNRMPAHRTCHRIETSTEDVPRIAKAKRQRAKHIGAARPAGTIKNRGFSPPAKKTRDTTKLDSIRALGLPPLARLTMKE